MAIISDYLSHDKYAVHTFIKLVLQQLSSKVREFNAIVFFSDGAASQFKQKFTLSSIAHFSKKVSWNFFFKNELAALVTLHVQDNNTSISLFFAFPLMNLFNHTCLNFVRFKYHLHTSSTEDVIDQ